MMNFRGNRAEKENKQSPPLRPRFKCTYHWKNKMKDLQNSYRKWLYLSSITYTLILNFATQTNGLSYNQYNSNHNRASNCGWISPDGEINQPLGEPLEIFCTIDSACMEAKSFTSENLFFEDEEEIMVNPQNVTIVNETTISIYLLNEEESTYLYACFLTVNKTRASNLKSQSVENTVSRGSVRNSITAYYKYISAISNGSYEYEILIGYALVSVKAGPLEVENLRCILFHFSLLKCIWDVPLNSAETNYTIQYVPINSAVSEEIAECPNNDDLSKNMCTWSPLTNPPYLNIYENLNITIKGTNDYGEIEQSFMFNKFENIQPDGLSGLNAVKVMPTSVKLCWQIGDLKNYPNDWTYEILFKGEEDSQWLNLLCDSKNMMPNEDNICYNVTGLEVNTNYTFSIRMRSSLAPPHNDYWSPYYTATFQTKPLLPTYVPETDMSLFRIYSTKSDHFRNVSIFWRPMKSSRLYGDSFHYEIKVYEVGEDGSKKIASKIQPKYKDNFEAKYELGPSAYQFVIRSANSEGKAKNASSINIPAAKDEVKINLLYYYISYLNRTCDYIWQPTKDNLNIVNYTLFQFSYLKDAHGNVLNNNLSTHLIHLPANVTRYRLVKDLFPTTNGKLERVTRTYVSAKTNKSSTALIPRLFNVYSVTDYFKSEQYVKKVEKWNKLSKRRKIQGELKHSAAAVHIGWKFSDRQYHEWLNKIVGN